MIKTFIASLLTCFSVASASAVTLKINQLSCSGLGAYSGYTTLNLTSQDTISLSSTMYFVNTFDNNVEIITSRILATGQVVLDLYSPKFRSYFSLVMSGPVGPAQLKMKNGVDTLMCESNILGINE